MLELSTAEEQQISLALVAADKCLMRAATLSPLTASLATSAIAEARRQLQLCACSMVSAINRQDEMLADLAALADVQPVALAVAESEPFYRVA